MSAEFYQRLKLSTQIKPSFLKITFNLYLEISPYCFHKKKNWNYFPYFKELPDKFIFDKLP